MIKSFLKELIIVLLLVIAIILIIGILFYDYLPMSKTLPTEVSYSTPEEVKELAASSGIEEQTIIMTYSVDSTDLNNYQRSQDYVPGKANPFSSYVTDVPDDETGTTNGNVNNSNSGTTNEDNDPSDGTLYPDSDLK